VVAARSRSHAREDRDGLLAQGRAAFLAALAEALDVRTPSEDHVLYAEPDRSDTPVRSARPRGAWCDHACRTMWLGVGSSEKCVDLGSGQEVDERAIVLLPCIPDPLDDGAVLGTWRAAYWKKRVDRREPAFALRRIATVLLDVVQKRADRRRVEVVQCERRRRLLRCCCVKASSRRKVSR